MKHLARAFNLAVAAAPACSSDRASSATVAGAALPAWTNLVLNQGIATHVDP